MMVLRLLDPRQLCYALRRTCPEQGMSGTGCTEARYSRLHPVGFIKGKHVRANIYSIKDELALVTLAPEKAFI